MRHEKKTVFRDDEDDVNEDNEDDEACEDYFATPPKRNKPAALKGQHKKKKATINPDLVSGAVGTADDSSDEDPTTAAGDPRRNRMTKAEHWTRRDSGEG